MDHDRTPGHAASKRAFTVAATLLALLFAGCTTPAATGESWEPWLIELGVEPLEAPAEPWTALGWRVGDHWLRETVIEAATQGVTSVTEERVAAQAASAPGTSGPAWLVERVTNVTYGSFTSFTDTKEWLDQETGAVVATDQQWAILGTGNSVHGNATHVYESPCLRMRFPIDVGSVWTATCRWRVDQHDTNTSKVVGLYENVEVAGYDRITVPAGTFEAYRLEIDREDDGVAQRVLSWWSPEACGPVMQLVLSDGDPAVTRLLGGACGAGGWSS
ncbi:MAG: hypothetical protein ACPGQL_06275 [Thermoplasmatota archaeon]